MNGFNTKSRVQEFFICDWWFNFDCAEAEDFYGKNDENAAAAKAVDDAGIHFHYKSDMFKLLMTIEPYSMI